MTAETLGAQPLFASLHAAAIEQILRSGEVIRLQARQRLSGLVDPAAVAGLGERYCFVLAGEVAIVLDDDHSDQAEPRSTAPGRTEHVGSFRVGELFSDGFLPSGGPAGTGPRVDCVASTRAVLLAVRTSTVAALMQQYPDWAGRLSRAMGTARQLFLRHQEPTRRLVQDFYFRHGYGASRRVRVSETSRCFDCDKCEAACAKRHGQARMSRSHAQLGRLAFQQFCVDCKEQPCLQACATGAMVVLETGTVAIGEACNGCGACARKCPYGAIRIVEIPYRSTDFSSPVPLCRQGGATSVPGLFVVGDAAGRRSTKQTIHDAKEAVDAMRCGNPGAAQEGTLLDVVIVGAGLAGTTAAQRCRERGLRFVVLEKATALSAKAARLASQLPIGAGMEVLGIGPASSGLLRVDMVRGSYWAANVLLCTGSSAEPSLLRRAGAVMIEPGAPAMAAYAASRGTHAVGIKCDNCAGHADRACVQACPTASLIELEPRELFFESGGQLDGAPVFSGVAFVEGVIEHRARRRPKGLLSAVLAAGAVLALVVLGLECFLRRALPEHSVLGMLRGSVGSADPVWYSSGKGFGHWLGYVGTGFMLATLFYPLRTRCGLLKGWGAQSSWLTLHLWVGVIGATLVTYHAAFKLDRWVALACYAMWTVVLSGAIGRYLYGMIHSGIGLAELEREALSRSFSRWPARTSLGSHALKLLSAELAGPGRIYTEVFVMLWHELRDFAILGWLRVAGLRSISDARQRRETLRYLVDIAAQRRAHRYLESARRLLRYWNWIHIVLTIAMFVLSGFHITYGFMYKAV